MEMTDIMDELSADVIIVGSGVGGGTLAYALKDSGASVLLVERGDFLRRERENWSPETVFEDHRYRTSETWTDGQGNAFNPGVHYYVGGNSKVYGASLPRFRASDFESVRHYEGTSSAWPFTYTDLEPYYAQAETLYRVHGSPSEDLTEPSHSTSYMAPALDDEPFVASLRTALKSQGLHPYAMPMGVDWRPDGACVRCRTCDGFPCMVDGKSDADLCAVRPALASPSVELLTNTYVERLNTSAGGHSVTEAVARRDGEQIRLRGNVFVVAAGATNSAALLLRSSSEQHPSGLANSSGMVGRNYMVHNLSFMLAAGPRRENHTYFQKTLGVNDFYEASGRRLPLGNLQMLGKLQAAMIVAKHRRVPRASADLLTRRSIEWVICSEDLPSVNNRVTLDRSGNIVVNWTPTNMQAHRLLRRRARNMMLRAGFPVVLAERADIGTNSHQCGTVVAGNDPAHSVLDTHCRSHDVQNLFVVDGSFFPSSAAMNPALTIAAQALRVAAEGNILG